MGHIRRIKCECLEKYGVIRHIKDTRKRNGRAKGVSEFRYPTYAYCCGCELHYSPTMNICDHCRSKLRKTNHGTHPPEIREKYESTIVRY